jgi:2-dehydropantoate 2-reductase
LVAQNQKKNREESMETPNFMPKVVMIGAGAMGGVLAGALAKAGADLAIVDTDAAHVDAIRSHGLAVEGLGDPSQIPAATALDTAGAFDLAVIMTPAYETPQAAITAQNLLKPEGAAVSCQNGLGNMEALVDVLGAERVFMGSTKCSADRPAPGCPRITKIDPTTVGELDGSSSARTDWMARTLSAGGLPCAVSDNIEGVLWSKFIHNCAINALSAITGLRMGQVTRNRTLGQLRWTLVDEALAVAEAKGITLADPNPRATLTPHVWRKFTQPSMLQHVEQGRPIEIEAINGYVVREGQRLGIPTPMNEIVTALAAGRGQAAVLAGQEIDYAALTAEAEQEIERGETPWESLP